MNDDDQLPWFQKYPRAYLEGTRDLTPEQRGLYEDCLCLIYLHDRELPKNDAWMAHELHVNARVWRRVRDVLIAKGKLVDTGTGFMNNRAMFEVNSRKIRRKIAEDSRKIRRRFSEDSAKIPGIDPELPLDINEARSRLRGKVGPYTRGRAGARDLDSELEVKDSPLPPPGGETETASGNTFWRGVLNPQPEADVLCNAGVVSLEGATRERWLAEFGGDAKALDMALAAIRVREASTEPIPRQVERALARTVGDRLDRDRRYQAAVVANGSRKGSKAGATPSAAVGLSEQDRKDMAIMGQDRWREYQSARAAATTQAGE